MKKYLLLLLLLLSSCATTKTTTKTSTRDSLVSRVNTRVDSIYIDRWHSIQQRADTVYRTDSIYVEKYRYLAKHDTIIVTHTDTITVAVPTPPSPLKGGGGRGWKQRFLALSERVRIWGKGFLLGGIVFFLLYWLLRIVKALYLR